MANVAKLIRSNTNTRRNSASAISIGAGTLPDMPCGVNGEDFVQSLRLVYFTAECKHGCFSELRIWGPRVLKDNTVGVRTLDHRWHDVNDSGPIELSPLPPTSPTGSDPMLAKTGSRFLLTSPECLGAPGPPRAPRASASATATSPTNAGLIARRVMAF